MNNFLRETLEAAELTLREILETIELEDSLLEDDPAEEFYQTEEEHYDEKE